MKKGKSSINLLSRLIITVLLVGAGQISLGQIWTENFGNAATCGSIDTAEGATATMGGTWSLTLPTTNSVDTTNNWFISARENYTGNGNCGDGCTNTSNLDRTLHVSTNQGAIDPSATYNNDSITDIIIWSPAIVTTGSSNLYLEMDYLEGGDNSDNGTVVVAVGNTATFTTVLDPAKTNTGSCATAGEWAHAAVYLDTAYNNQVQLFIGYRWQSTSTGSGTDPSFAIDNIRLVDTVPVASFTMSSDTICDGGTINFTSTTTGGSNTSYAWDFTTSGTPSTSNDKNPSNIMFSGVGTINVELTVTNAVGSHDTIIPITVIACNPPVPNFQTSDLNDTLCIGQCIDFFDISTPGSLGKHEWQWQFQGGSPNTSTAQNPTSICYTNPGSYNVTLTVADTNAGTTATDTFVGAIFVDNCAIPTATFDSDTNVICNNDHVEYYAETTGVPDSILWIFQGGNPSSIMGKADSLDTISVFYPTAGIYDVTIVAWNEAGTGTDTVVDYVEVKNCPVPKAKFDVSSRTICPGVAVVFEDLSQHATEWFWEFPGGVPSTSTDQHPSNIRYDSAGVYPVILIVRNVNGSDTLIRETYINVDSCLPPDPRFELERDSICRSSCVQFTNTSLRTDSLYWIFWWHPYGDSITGTSADTIDTNTVGYEWMKDDPLFADTFFVIWKDFFPVMPRVFMEDDPIFCFEDSGSIGVQMFCYNQHDVSVLNQQDIAVLNIGGKYPTMKVGPDKHVLIDNIESRFFLDDTVSFETTGTGQYWSWYPEEGLSCYDCPRPMIHPTYTRKYYVTNYDDYKCQVYDSVTVFVETSYAVGIPNMFSPNGDGNNDILWARGNGISSQGFVLRIWNRYSDVVFESYHQNNGWDGTYKNAPAPEGAYNYYLKVIFENGQTSELTGNVTLVRY